MYILLGKEKREESDTHVMDTRWRKERNVMHTENREECIRKKREESDTHVIDIRWRTERNVIHRENREEYVQYSILLGSAGQSYF